MKRFHVHIAVESIAQSTPFYTTLFGQAPTVAKSDYAKWMLDDPRINFAISERPARAGQTGLDHLGFQMDSSPELHAMTAQLQSAGLAVTGQGETTCCQRQLRSSRQTRSLAQRHCRAASSQLRHAHNECLQLLLRDAIAIN
jgi:hypothetical protein